MNLLILEISAILIVTLFGKLTAGKFRYGIYFFAFLLTGGLLLLYKFNEPAPDQSSFELLIIWIILSLPLLVSAAVSNWFSRQRADAPIAIVVAPLLVGAISIIPVFFTGLLVAIHVFGHSL